MAQTVGRLTASMEVWDGYNADDLMVIDEAHHAAAGGLGAGDGAVARPHYRHDRHSFRADLSLSAWTGIISNE